MGETCKGCTEWALMYDRERTGRENLRQRVTILEAELERREARIAELEAGSDADGREWVAEVEDLRRQLTYHVDLVNRRNEQVAELRRQVEELRRQLANEKAAFVSMAEHHEAETATLKAELEQAQAIIRERDAEIEQLREGKSDV
jgi:chromosome segregation ATPase